MKVLRSFVMTFIFLSGSLSVFAQPCVETTLEQEYHALMAFYEATNGSQWTNDTGWSSADPNVVQSVAGWYGVVTDVNGHVIELTLINNNLIGELPEEIGDFSKMEILYLKGNAQLQGSIPSSIGKLCALKGLNLYNNHLTGNIPSSLGRLQNLTGVDLSFNYLTGPIPDSVGGLSNLRFLEMDRNQLSGSIPTQVGALSALKWFSVTGNALTGKIPSEFGLLSNLETLNLSDNQLTGSIPQGLGALENLSSLNLQVNKLSGTVPATFGNHPALQFLNIRRNRFTFSNFLAVKQSYTGSTMLYTNQDSVDVKRRLSATVGKPLTLRAYVDRNTNPLSKFRWFKYVNGSNDIALGDSASVTGHTFTIPSMSAGDIGSKYYYTITNAHTPDLTLVSRLQTVRLSSTDSCISTLEDEYKALMTFYIATDGDQWTNNTGWRDADPNVVQSVSGWYGVLTDINGHVIQISMSNNNLAGQLPEEIGDFSKMEILFLKDNVLLQGNIPSSIGNFCALKRLNLYNNNLTGPIPSSLGDLQNLTGMDLSFNQLTDSIPSSLGGLINLQYFEMDNNLLSGSIPSQLGGLSVLKWLSVSNNQLSGTMPMTFSALSNLEHLNLSHNKLTGNIPSGLGDLPYLSSLNLQVNYLSGNLPAGFGNHPALNYLAFNVNKFTFINFLSIKEGYAGSTFVYAPQDSVDVKKTIQSVTGTPIVLTTGIDRTTSPLSKYQWFRYVNGSNDVKLIPSPSTDGHTYIIQNPTIGDSGAKYYYKIYNDSATSLVLISRMQTLQVHPCTINTSVNLSTQQYLCATKFSPVVANNGLCQVTGYSWNFGDGVTSTVKNPLHSYGSPGTYTVSLRYSFTCGNCQKDTTITRQVTYNPAEDILKDSLFIVSTDKKEQVISASAATFSDSWPLAYNKDLDTLNSFLNGSEGVWRNDASYVYDVPRQLSVATDLSKDGTFSMDQFNWEDASLNAIPHWIKANSMTQYSPFSYELENRDVLGVYSSALYDYGGQLPSANGVNMRNAEMAFTSFESPGENVTGNWIFGSDPVPVQNIYTVQSGRQYKAIVEASMQELAGVTKVDVVAKGFAGHFGLSFVKIHRVKKDVAIVCMQVHPLNPKWTIIVLEQSPFTFHWKGELIVKNEVTPIVTSDIDSTVAHAGKSSLKVLTGKIFRQDILKLDSAKSYWFSGWVSINNPNVSIPVLAEGLGADILIKDKHDQVVATFLMAPSGRIIEGWQQVKGSFICPISNATVEIKFKPGSTGTAWYDDIRLHPEKGNMKAYVYNPNDYRLRAILDEENFASFFYYDQEGNLYLTKKETEAGIKTITENITYLKESGN